MKKIDVKNHTFVSVIIRFLWGILVGFGAIMPGISGGTLCVAFGMYKPLIEILAHPVKGMKKHAKAVLPFIIGAAVGFVGLSGLAGYLLEKSSVIMTCIFAGFILGTFPELVNDAGEKGRGISSYIAMIIGFVVMFAVLFVLKRGNAVMIEPGIWSYLFCGLLWGLSFIVPGLSSSSLLMFFGLYQPMLEGISRFNPLVILPVGGGAVACAVLLSGAVNKALEKFYAVISHCIIGIVAATTIMILPSRAELTSNIAAVILSIAGGAAVSYTLGRMCSRLLKK